MFRCPMPIDTDKARERLLALKLELENQARSSEHTRAPVELDQQAVGRLSRMDAMQVQAMANAAQARRSGELARIDAALKRIEDDDYGYCVACGEEIAEKRLEFDPAAPSCVKCASGGS